MAQPPAAALTRPQAEPSGRIDSVGIVLRACLVGVFFALRPCTPLARQTRVAAKVGAFFWASAVVRFRLLMRGWERFADARRCAGSDAWTLSWRAIAADETLMATSTKVRENRVRRVARRRGLYVAKSARRDPRAIGFGRWWVTDDFEARWFLCPNEGLTLDELEASLEDALPSNVHHLQAR
jgi:hypothetical protein